MRLTILNVAYPLAPVGPDAVGGAEQILSALDAALIRLERRFSLERMCRQYLAVYETLATESASRSSSAARRIPTSSDWLAHRSGLAATADKLS